MIKPSDIVRHLKQYISLFTDEFTEVLDVTSATSSGSYIEVTSPLHGMYSGQSFILSGGVTKNIVTGVEEVDGLYKVTCNKDHDLIMPSQPLDAATVNVVGLGEFSILSVPNRNQFVVDFGYTPTIDGSQYVETAILPGVYTVHGIINVNKFNFSVENQAELQSGSVQGLKIIKGYRVAAAATYKRAEATYSTQTMPYLYVVMGDASTSKDRHTLNDSVAGFTRQDAGQLNICQRFSTVVFFPTTSDHAGVLAQDKAYGDMLTAQMRCLLGYSGDGDTIIQYLAVPVTHGPNGTYNTAYYSHVYEWELTQVVDYQDGFLSWPDVAFRDILTEFSGYESKINLDEELFIDPYGE